MRWLIRLWIRLTSRPASRQEIEAEIVPPEELAKSVAEIHRKMRLLRDNGSGGA